MESDFGKTAGSVPLPEAAAAEPAKRRPDESRDAIATAPRPSERL